MFEQAERPVSTTRDRLRAALNQPLRGEPAVRRESVTELLDLSSLGGHWFESEHGPGYVIESIYEAGHSHGDVVLHRALAIEPGRLAGQIRDPRLGDTLASEFLYVDTETTGLGGAGMMVFLAGVARFDGSTLRLRQFLLPGPQYEGGLLGGLTRELDGAQALVSYNGKSFDVPALESRYILSRQTPMLRTLPHLDLLHPNRRLFKGVIESHQAADGGTRAAGVRAGGRLPLFGGAGTVLPLPAERRPDAHTAGAAAQRLGHPFAGGTGGAPGFRV